MERRSPILLLEDSPDDVFLFERALRECGLTYDVHVTQSGAEGIDYLRRACRGGDVPEYPVPKFIILDNHMPAHSGADFLRWISENRIYEVVPTVILSGSDQPSDVKRAFHLGVHGYFLKPTDRGQLVQVLKTIFQYWAASRVPPVKEYQVTGEGEHAMLKTE